MALIDRSSRALNSAADSILNEGDCKNRGERSVYSMRYIYDEIVHERASVMIRATVTVPRDYKSIVAIDTANTLRMLPIHLGSHRNTGLLCQQFLTLCTRQNVAFNSRE